MKASVVEREQNKKKDPSPARASFHADESHGTPTMSHLYLVRR